MKDVTRDERTEKAGYACPPQHTRWKKGESGNRSGRPKAAVSPQKMSQAILQTRLKSKRGRKLNRTRQDQMMLQTALDAVSSVKAGRLIFKIAYPKKAAIPRIPNDVLADLYQLCTMQQSELKILPTDDQHEAQRKYDLTLRIGHLEAKIARAIEHIPLPGEDDDE